MMRRTRIALLVAAAIGACGGEPEGPLEGGPAGLDVVGAPMPVGKVRTYGQITIGNASDRPLVIEDVDVQHDEGLEVLRVMLAGEDRDISIGHGHGFPPRELKDVVVPARGATVPPIRPKDAGTELVIGLRVNRPGRWELRGVTVRYRQGDRSYVKRIDALLVLCAPKGTPCRLDRRTVRRRVTTSRRRGRGAPSAAAGRHNPHHAAPGRTWCGISSRA